MERPPPKADAKGAFNFANGQLLGILSQEIDPQ